MPGPVVQIDQGRIREQLDEVVRAAVEETLNALLDAGADRLWGARELGGPKGVRTRGACRPAASPRNGERRAPSARRVDDSRRPFSSDGVESNSSSCQIGYVPNKLWMQLTARAPSPIAKATRLVAPLRQSPLAKTPGKLVSSASGSRRSFQLSSFATAEPVNAKPLSSRATSAGRKSVLGLAPMKIKTPVVSSRATLPTSSRK